MVEESRRGAWFVVAGALTFHLILASLPSQALGGTGFARALIMDVLTPVERFVDRSVGMVSGVWNDYVALLDTRQENERLQAEVDRLTLERHLDREAVLEAQRLRQFFDVETFSRDSVVARVTGGNPSISQRTITLDKGQSTGVEPGSPGVTPDGIVGRVIYTSYASSILQLVTDPVSAVGGVVQESRIQGIVRGDGSNLLVFEHSEPGAVVVPGQLIVTSGSERIYPKGLPIGVVVTVDSVTDLVSAATIEPSANLSRLEEILLLGPQPETFEAPVMPEPAP